MPFTNIHDKPSLDPNPSFSKKNTSSYPLDPKHGFSLIEIIITIFLISALALILTSSAGSLHTRKRTDLVALADKAATKEIERIRNLDFITVVTASSLPCDPEFNTQLQNCRIDRIVYDNFGGTLNLKQVIINLYYNYQGNSRFITMETLITPGGL